MWAGPADPGELIDSAGISMRMRNVGRSHQLRERGRMGAVRYWSDLTVRSSSTNIVADVNKLRHTHQWVTRGFGNLERAM